MKQRDFLVTRSLLRMKPKERLQGIKLLILLLGVWQLKINWNEQAHECWSNTKTIRKLLTKTLLLQLKILLRTNCILRKTSLIRKYQLTKKLLLRLQSTMTVFTLLEIKGTEPTHQLNQYYQTTSIWTCLPDYVNRVLHRFQTLHRHLIRTLALVQYKDQIELCLPKTNLLLQIKLLEDKKNHLIQIVLPAQ
jgi:hypothetical protein